MGLVSQSHWSNSEDTSGRLKFPWEFVQSRVVGYPVVDVANENRNQVNNLGKSICVRYTAQMRDFDANPQAYMDFHYMDMFFHRPPRQNYNTRTDPLHWIYLKSRDQKCEEESFGPWGLFNRWGGVYEPDVQRNNMFDAIFGHDQTYPVRCRIWRRDSDARRVMLNSRIKRRYDNEKDNDDGRKPGDPFAGSGCLAGSTQVQVLSHSGAVQIASVASLKPGDLIQVAGGVYEPLIGFLHKDHPRHDLPFVQLEFSNDENTASELLSPDHMVFLADGTSLRAADIRTNDLLAGDMLVDRVEFVRDKLF